MNPRTQLTTIASCWNFFRREVIPPDAGPKELRWIASVIASVAFIAVAFLAVPVAALSFELPRSLVTSAESRRPAPRQPTDPAEEPYLFE